MNQSIRRQLRRGIGTMQEKLSEERLSEAATNFTAVPEVAKPYVHSEDYVIVTDPRGVITYANNAVFRRTGYRTSEIVGKKPGELWGGHMGREFYASMWHTLAIEKKPVIVEVRNTKKDGTAFVIDLHIYPVLDAAGEVEAYLGVEIDITERIAALAENNEKLQLLIEHSPAAIAMFDTKMQYIIHSQRWLTDLHVGGDLRGRSHYEVFPEIPDRWKEAYRRGLAGEVLRSAEDTFLRQDGTVQWLHWEIRPWYRQPGVVGGIIVFAEFITELKAMQTELRRAAEMRDELAAVAHRAKSPASGARLLLELINTLDSRNLSAEQRDLLKDIASANEKTLKLLHDMLILSRMQNTDEQAERKADFKALVESIVQGHATEIARKQLQIAYKGSLSICPSTPYLVKEIIDNLVSNAVKYSKLKGTITLGCKKGGDGIVFFVSDEGLGIPHKDQAQLFTQSFRASNVRGPEYVGSTGLGLFLSKHIAQRLGYTLSFFSKEAAGTTFFLHMPHQ